MGLGGLHVTDKPNPRYLSGPWWRPFKQDGPIDVVSVDLSPHTGHEAMAWDWLDEAERTRWRAFQYPGPRRRFALCRAALRITLTERLGCDNDELAFETLERGKPVAIAGGKPAQVSFNVSHSGRHGLIAYKSKGRVGIDVEERTEREDLDGLIETVFGPHERLELSALAGEPRLRLFYDLWTIKEALVKALGDGHQIDFSQFQAPQGMRRGEPVGKFRFPHLPSPAWRVENLGNEDFAAALAYEVIPV